MKLVVALWFLVALLPSGQAWATFVPCVDPAQCSWTMAIGGNPVMNGTYQIDSQTGDIFLPAPVSFTSGDDTINIDFINGNVDPILGFGLGAATGAAGNAFSFTMTLPIAISGLIDANSSISYSLSSLSAAGAQVAPFLTPKILEAKEIDSTVFGLPALDKNVDAGDTFAFLGGPVTQNSPVYTNSSQFVGDLAYDLMSVTVAFQLSPNSTVGMSGFVQQVEAPEPGTILLIGLALAGFALRRHA